MDLPSFVIAIAFVVTLVLQGVSCLLARQRPLSIGLLDLAFASIVLVGSMYLASGHLVIATEFGALMVQGSWAEWSLRASIGVVAILPGICWYRVRKLNDWPASLALIILLGAAIGIWAGGRIVSVNPGYPENLRVYIYDVWWPPLIVWLAVCFAGAVLALIKAEGVLVFIACTAALLAPLAGFTLRFSDLMDPHSRPDWIVIERVSFLVAVTALTFLITKDLRRKLRVLLVFGFVCLSLVLAAYTVTPLSRDFLDLVPLIPLLGILVGSVAKAEVSTTEEGSPSVQQFRAVVSFASSAIPIARITGVALALSLPIIGLFAIDLFSVGYFSRAVDLGVIAVVWTFLAEKLAQGALDTLPQLFKDDVLQLTILTPISTAISAAFPRIWGFAAAVAKVASQARWLTAIGTVITTLFFLALLTSLNEIFNYGKIVVGSFQWTGIKADPDDISALIPGDLINAIGLLQQDLRPDLVIPESLPLDKVRKLATVSDDTSLEAAVAKSEDLNFGGVSVPLNFFVPPLKHLARSMLGIRVIAGTVQKNNGHYVILANSSSGDSWLSPSGGVSPEESGQAKKDPLKDGNTSAAAVTGTDSPHAVAISDDDSSCEVHGANGIGDLIDELAFDVASGAPSFVAKGLTRNWRAFAYFRRGLEYWRSFVRDQKSRELKEAVGCFKAAVHKDSSFAAAYYRLGVAMQRSHEPEQALAAFQSSVAADSDFVAGADMEASTLYDFNSYYPAPPAALLSAPIASERKRQASRIWSEIAGNNGSSVQDKRQAAFGICWFEYDNAPPAHSGSDLLYLPYYYCSRADALKFALPMKSREGAQESTFEASVLNLLGVVIESHLLSSTQAPFLGDWACSADAIDPADINPDGTFSKVYMWGGPKSAAALEHYRKALDLNPQDATIRCNEANAMAYVRKDPTAMEYLKGDSSVHLALANSLVQQAQEARGQSGSNPRGVQTLSREEIATRCYEAALREFETAAALDKASATALNLYAYTFWEWEMDWLRQRTSLGPTRDVGFKAERSAREAIRIAVAQDNPEMELTAKETLGEVLLGRGRAKEAEEQLELVLMDKRSDDWDGRREAGWDLAKAKVCDAAAGGSRKAAEFAEAMRDFANLQQNERNLYGLNSDLNSPDLDVVTQAAECPLQPDAPSAQGFPLVMQAQNAIRLGRDCVSSLVADVHCAKSPSAGYILHVWGRDFDDKINLANGSPRSILLSSRSEEEHLPTSETGHFRVFAQLEDSKGQAVSAINAFDVDDSSKENDCSPSQLTLRFDEAPLASAATSKKKR